MTEMADRTSNCNCAVMDTKISVTNIRYMKTVSLNGACAQHGYVPTGTTSYHSGKNDELPFFPSNLEDEEFFAFLEDRGKYAVKLCDSSDWLMSECGDSEQQGSWVSDEELKEVFDQMKAAAVSSTMSEVTIISREPEEDLETPKWDTDKWKEYYEANRPKPPVNVPVLESAKGDRKMSKFGNDSWNVRFNQEILERIKSLKEKRDTSQSNESKKSKTRNSIKSRKAGKKIKRGICDSIRYNKYGKDTWLLDYYSREEVEAFQARKQWKREFTPAWINCRSSDKLNHKNIIKEIKPEAFNRLDCKFEPHEKFPDFGEGKFVKTAVSKEYTTFTPERQMEINRANYILDQRLQKLKNRKSAVNISDQNPPDQSSSYKNRMRKYQKIHEENKKIAKMFDPNQIRTSSEVKNHASKTSFVPGKSKSSTSQFSREIYTKSYDKKTVKKLVNSTNPYGVNKPLDKVPKKYRRPQWDVGHIDYRRPEVKPIQYKSIRKLPVIILNIKGSTNASAEYLLKPSNTYGSGTQTSLSLVNSKANTSSTLQSSLRNKSGSKTYRKVTDNSNAKNQVKGQVERKIPLRKAHNSRNFDLNDEKFEVFKSWNKKLFESNRKDWRRRNVVANEYEMKGKRTTENMIRECREFESEGKQGSGGGDATDNVMSEACNIQNNENNHQTNEDKQLSERSNGIVSCDIHYNPSSIDESSFDLSGIHKNNVVTSNIRESNVNPSNINEFSVDSNIIHPVFVSSVGFSDICELYADSNRIHESNADSNRIHEPSVDSSRIPEASVDLKEETLSTTSSISIDWEENWEDHEERVERPQRSCLPPSDRSFTDQVHSISFENLGDFDFNCEGSQFSFGSLIESGFVSTLDAISERTESVGSNVDLSPARVNEELFSTIDASITHGLTNIVEESSAGKLDDPLNPLITDEFFDFDIVRLKVELQLNQLRFNQEKNVSDKFEGTAIDDMKELKRIDID